MAKAKHQNQDATTTDQPATDIAPQDQAAMATVTLPEDSAGADQADDCLMAHELLAYLDSTGTPDTTLKPLAAWVKGNGGDDVTAYELFRHMEAQDVTQGTLRKAGKHLFGEEFEPSCAVEQVPADEIVRLRQENERLHERIKALVAERNTAQKQVQYLEAKVADVTGQMNYLQVGRREQPVGIG